MSANDSGGGREETGKTPFRSFAENDFYPTASWARLAEILMRNGGAYGLHGPRGAGKTWIMRKAIAQTNNDGGMGLWFPCPSDYDTMAFLSALSDNLASEVERRFTENALRRTAQRLRPALIFAALLPVAIAVLTYVIHELDAKGTPPSTIFSSIPPWLWTVVGVALLLLLVIFVGLLSWDISPVGRLTRTATTLRERIRYTTDLTLARELDISGGGAVTAALKRSEQRSLGERPATIASLVFDFRNLAEHIVATTGKQLVIGIDELDKIKDPDAVRNLLRDVKGVFEITNVFFLVSVSEEAAVALQLGSLQADGRNEFNSSFYTVFDLPPLSVEETAGLLESRKIEVSPVRAQLLCLLGEGNWREAVRLAEVAAHLPARPTHVDPERWLLMKIIEAEAATLLGEIINHYGTKEAADSVLVGVFNALPSAAFSSPDEFVELSRNAVRQFWQPGWSDGTWKGRVRESWQRLLVRLFVAGSVITPLPATGGRRAYSAEEIMDLRDVLIMGSHSSVVAYVMLKDRFGDHLGGPYTAPTGIRVMPGAVGNWAAAKGVPRDVAAGRTGDLDGGETRGQS